MIEQVRDRLKTNLRLKSILSAFFFLQSTLCSAQADDCLASEVLKNGVSALHSNDALAMVRQRQSVGAPLSPEMQKLLFKREYTNCIRTRDSVLRPEVFDLVYEYQAKTYNSAVGKWVSNRAIDVTTLGESVISRRLGTTLLAAGAIQFAPVDYAVDTIYSREGLLDRAISIAFAEADQTGDKLNAETVLAALERELEKKDSFFIASPETKEAIYALALRRARDIQRKSPEGQGAENWFRETFLRELGFKGNPSKDSLKSFADNARLKPLTSKQKADLREVDSRIKRNREEAKKISAQAAALLTKTDEVAINGRAVIGAANDKTTWNDAQQVLNELGRETVRDPRRLKEEVDRRLADCKLNCGALTLIAKDAVFRIAALEMAEGASKLAIAAENVAKILNGLGVDAETTRTVSSVSSISGQVVKIAGMLTVSGPLGPLGWLSLSGEIVGLGSTLSGLMGAGGVDANAERHKQMMEAIAKLSRQIEDLRREMLSQFANQERHLGLVQLYADLTLDVLTKREMYSGLAQCQNIARSAERNSLQAADQVLNEIQRDSGFENNLGLCLKWLTSNPSDVVRLRENEVHHLYRSILKSLDEGGISTAFDAGSRDELVARIQIAQDTHDRLLNLTRHALLFYSRGYSTPASWAVLMSVPSGPKQTDDSLRDLIQEKLPNKGPAQVELGGLLAALGDPSATLGSEIQSNLTFSRVLQEPIETPIISQLLTAAAIGHLVKPFITLQDMDGFEKKLAVRADTTEDVYRSRMASHWLVELSALAHLAIVQEVMYRGDFIVPMISYLLANHDEVSSKRCQAKPPDLNAMNLCDRFGPTELSKLIQDARIVVSTLPEIRANVGLWRIRQQLVKGLSSSQSLAEQTLKKPLFAREAASGKSFSPKYGLAYEQKDPLRLSELLPGEEIFSLNNDYENNAGFRMFTQDVERERRWFVRLSGSCSGLSRAAFNGRSVCKNGTCAESSVQQDAEGKWSIRTNPALKRPLLGSPKIDEWLKETVDVCVLAPLPTQEELDAGRFFARPQFEPVVAVAQHFIARTRHAVHIDKNIARSDVNDPSAEEARRKAFLSALHFRLAPVPLYKFE